MKECVACAETVKDNAKLCKHCGTLQPILAFDTAADDANSKVTAERAMIQKWLDSEMASFEKVTGFTIDEFVSVDHANKEALEKAGESNVWTLLFSMDFTTYEVGGMSSIDAYGCRWMPGYFEPDEDVDGYFIAKAKTKKMNQVFPSTLVMDCMGCNGECVDPKSKRQCEHCGGTGTWEFTVSV
jgi:hypothetical protein